MGSVPLMCVTDTDFLSAFFFLLGNKSERVAREYKYNLINYVRKSA